MDIRDAFMHYGIEIPKRFTTKEKIFYLQAVSKVFHDAGYEVKVKKSKRGRNMSYNLYAGDVNKANTIIISNFDTPIHNFGNPFHYYPLDGKTTFRKSFIPYYTPGIICLLVDLYLLLAYAPKVNFHDKPLFSTITLLLFVLITAIGWFMTGNIGNRVNLNRNTSGVVAAMQIAEHINNKNKVAFVLTDDGCSRHGGNYALRADIPNLDQKKVIVLDCLSDGEKTVVGCREGGKSFAMNIKKHLKDAEIIECETEALKFTSFSFFPNGILITRGYGDEGYVYAKNTATNKDTELQIEEMEQLISNITNYLNTL